jgi:hypothetical protein
MAKRLCGLFALAVSLVAKTQGWSSHEGGLLKYTLKIRFGEEPDTMPDGWKLGRVSLVAVDAPGNVYVFHRGAKADPMVVVQPLSSPPEPAASPRAPAAR